MKPLSQVSNSSESRDSEGAVLCEGSCELFRTISFIEILPNSSKSMILTVYGQDGVILLLARGGKSTALSPSNFGNAALEQLMEQCGTFVLRLAPEGDGEHDHPAEVSNIIQLSMERSRKNDEAADVSPAA